jgi:Ca2+-binding RTX toxin-like protein
VVDNAGDVVTEFFNQGNDSIYSSVNYVTPAHVENLFLTGSAGLSGQGNELANVLIGNAGSNSLAGGAGNDLLAGWLGNDSLDGGQDGDTYLWNQGDGRDTITESSANSGVDVLRFGAGITLDSLVSREFTDSAGNRRLFISVLDPDGQERADQGLELALNSSGTSVVERFELTGANGAFTSFNLSQIKVNTVTTNGGNGNDTLTGSRADDRIAGSNGDDTLYGRSGNDILWGDNGKDRLFGEGGDDKLWGGNDDDWLQGGAGSDELGGDNGKDTLLAGSGDDKLYGGNDADILDAGSGADLLIGDNGEDQLFAGDGNDTLYGGNDSDLLAAGAGNDLIDGDNGADIIIAGAGADTITAGNDGDFVDAGSGNDSIDTGNGADFIAGGKGADTISAGHDSDVIAFNRGDGQDTLITQDWQQDTLSLGGGIRYADLSLAKAGNNLILRTGSGDEIVFKDWYQGSSGQRNNVSRLQMITAATGGDYNASSTDRLRNKQAVQLDFIKLVNAFDSARASNAALSNGWAMTSASLNTAYLSGSNTQAIGGDLAWRYATLASSDAATGQEASYGNLNAAGVRSAMSGMGSLRAWTQNTPALVNPWIAMQAGLSLIGELPTGANPTLTPVQALTQDQLIGAALASQQQITGVARPSWS